MTAIKVHGFLYFRVSPEHRSGDTRKKVRTAAEEIQKLPGIVAAYPYSLIGLRTSAEVGFWLATEGVETFQGAGALFLRTGLELAASLWGFVRPSQYTGQSGISVTVPGPRKRYLVVYPFIKTHDWYQLAAEERRGMMKEHARVGHGFKEIDQVLVYSTGIADWEFVVGYETDDLERFSELVSGIRSTAGRPYTWRDTPIFAGRYGTLPEVLLEVFGEDDPP
jgi:chlorite dismutase